MTDSKETWLDRQMLDYDASRTPARLKFQMNDRIVLSAEAERQGLAWKVKGREVKSGWVVGFPQDGNKIRVKRNGLKTIQPFHINFWEKVND